MQGSRWSEPFDSQDRSCKYKIYILADKSCGQNKKNTKKNVVLRSIHSGV